LKRQETEAAALGLAAGVLAEFAAQVGPLAVVDLETTGLYPEEGAELLEVGALLVDPGEETCATFSSLVRPGAPLPQAIQRLTGLRDADVAGAPRLEEVRKPLAEELRGRILVAHNASFERTFLSRFVDRSLADATYLDTLDLLALTHPDAPDLRLESFTRMLLGTEEKHRALDDALDTARVMAAAGVGAAVGKPRYVAARHALEAYAADSPWLALLVKPQGSVARAVDPDFVAIGATDEPPVPFDEDAIASVLEDEERGRRHFPGYRVRAEQVELARRFVRNFDREEVLLAEGGTGVGKSLAYLAAAIPFAIEREESGEASPVVISTRTKLLQDQLLGRDIARAARFLGHPDLRAVSIKGRANYACARRLGVALAEGAGQSLFPEERMAFAVLACCAETRPGGEIGALPAALLRRYGPLRGLVRRSVAARAEHCTREQCAKQRGCPLGRRRAALGRAHLIVANHDLLLRWPPDYPAFEHAVVDEAHELVDVADEVYAVEVRPDAVVERVDEIFGRPATAGRRSTSLIPAADRKRFEADARAWRRDLDANFHALGRELSSHSGQFGELQVQDATAPHLSGVARTAGHLADRIEDIADRVPKADESSPALDRAVSDLRDAGAGLRLAFEEASPDSVAAFEDVLPPFDRWRLVVRRVSPAEPFHELFMNGMRSFAGVSASLFIDGDAFAALGVLELEERAGDRLGRVAVPSPFPYREHMRVVALRGGSDLVAETSDVLELVGRRLGGRTLGLFTSLRRMNDVGDELSSRLRDDGIEVIAPRRAADDPMALVTRFVNGGAVLLGARRFWQGIDIPGDALQAVVIEKLPFQVPTELRRRRERRLEERGIRSFQRLSLGQMLLHLKQMAGRLIRSEEDRGLVVIVEGRTDKGYFRRIGEELPGDAPRVLGRAGDLDAVLDELALERPKPR
jgi:ATP-dependent DNA helicase DinG